MKRALNLFEAGLFQHGRSGDANTDTGADECVWNGIATFLPEVFGKLVPTGAAEERHEISEEMVCMYNSDRMLRKQHYRSTK